MLDALSVPVINRLLRANTWALDTLRPYAGKTVRLVCLPAEVVLKLTDSGEVVAAPSGVLPDTTISVTPGVMLRLAARDESAWNAAEVSGDMQLAAAVDHVRRNLAWDFEEDLSRVFGDIAAHRMAQGLRGLDAFGRKAARNLAESFAEYATHEQPTLARPRAVEEFSREVDDARDHAARLEKRLELFRRRLEDS